jgi:hypothetical protein
MNLNETNKPWVMAVGDEPLPLASAKRANTCSIPTTTRAVAKPKVGNRFAVLNAFVDVTMQTLTRAEITVWMLLFRDTKQDGLARTAQTDLARRAGLNTRSVERAVRSLERCGLLKVVHRGGLRKGPSSCRISPLGNGLLTQTHKP